MNSTKSSTQNFGEATRTFIEAGIPHRALIPVAPVGARIAQGSRLKPECLGKAPGSYDEKSDTWSGLKGNYVQQGVRDRADQTEFAQWSTGTVGMLGRYAPAIDSDAESQDARRLVERVLAETFGQDAKIAERVRGTGPRRLYAFRAISLSDEGRIVRTRHIHYRLSNEPEHMRHKLDIIGVGNQYVVAGTHPSGDKYEWNPDASLAELFRTGEILCIEDADIVRFLEALEKEIAETGGAVLSSSGGRASGERWDYSDEDPFMPVDAVLDGLKRVANNEANFPDRDDIVRMLSMIRAALGREADAYISHIEGWACADTEWCPPDYFDQIWRSLDDGVRVERDALDREFRRRRVFVSAAHTFPDDVDSVVTQIREHKSDIRDVRSRLLAEVAAKYVFGLVNTRTDDNSSRIRSRANVSVEWQTLNWWNLESSDHQGTEMLLELQRQHSWSSGKRGLWSFLREMGAAYPQNFYSGEIRHPHYDFGDMVAEEDERGRISYRINMRHLPRVQQLAKSYPRDKERADEDLLTILEFVGRVFRDHAAYELDTLAYMVQTGGRPGHMLFLVGDQGTGKSLYSQLLNTMFDGRESENSGHVDGTKITNENALRFAFAKVEGRRIINIKELPEGSRSITMATITSVLKQMVDPGPDGDYFSIEGKGQDTRSVPNFARIIITSNYQNAIRVEAQDRRIFFISCGITSENKPDEHYYSNLVEIIQDPERLATFWRYLKQRDIRNYRVAAPPPVSLEKREAQITAMTNPIERHAEAAIMALKRAGRNLFDAKEISDLMAAMAQNEFKNSNGALDDRGSYEPMDIGKKRTLGIVLDRHAEKVGKFKSDAKRVPTIYCFKKAQDMIGELTIFSRDEMLAALERDRSQHCLSEEHPIPVFAGPLRRDKGTRNAEVQEW